MSNPDDLTAEYIGSVFGSIHSVFMGASPAFFTVRNKVGGALVKCIYKKEHYPSLVKALARHDANVYVQGRIRANRVTQEIDNLIVTKIQASPKLTDEDYNAFWGCAPNITGEFSTEDFVGEVWGDSEQ